MKTVIRSLSAAVLTVALMLPTAAWARRHRPFYKNWTTTQNVVSAAVPQAASAVSANFESNSTLCANTADPIGSGQEIPIAVASSVDGNPGSTTNWQMVMQGSILVVNNDVSNPVTIHFIGYVGNPTGCTDFASCSPLMTRIPGLFDGFLNGGEEKAIPFTLSQDQIPPTGTGLIYVAILIDSNGDSGQTVTCLSPSFMTTEHNDIP